MPKACTNMPNCRFLSSVTTSGYMGGYWHLGRVTNDVMMVLAICGMRIRVGQGDWWRMRMNSDTGGWLFLLCIFFTIDLQVNCRFSCALKRATSVTPTCLLKLTAKLMRIRSRVHFYRPYNIYMYETSIEILNVWSEGPIYERVGGTVACNACVFYWREILFPLFRFVSVTVDLTPIVHYVIALGYYSRILLGYYVIYKNVKLVQTGEYFGV